MVGDVLFWPLGGLREGSFGGLSFSFATGDWHLDQGILLLAGLPLSFCSFCLALQLSSQTSTPVPPILALLLCSFLLGGSSPLCHSFLPSHLFLALLTSCFHFSPLPPPSVSLYPLCKLVPAGQHFVSKNAGSWCLAGSSYFAPLLQLAGTWQWCHFHMSWQSIVVCILLLLPMWFRTGAAACCWKIQEHLWRWFIHFDSYILCYAGPRLISSQFFLFLSLSYCISPLSFCPPSNQTTKKILILVEWPALGRGATQGVWPTDCIAVDWKTVVKVKPSRSSSWIYISSFCFCQGIEGSQLAI